MRKSDSIVDHVSITSNTPCVIRRLRFLLKGTGLVYVFMLVIIFIVISLVRITYPFSIDYASGPIYVEANRFVGFSLAHLYSPYSGTHVVPAVYPPLYYGLIAAVVRWGAPTYLVGRLISTVSLLCIVYLVYKVIYVETNNKLASALCSSTFLVWPIVLNWSAFVRSDFTGVAFALLGMYRILYGRKYKIAGAVGSFLLSLSSKHSYVIAPVVAGLALLRQDKRQFFKYMFLLFISVSALGATLEYLSDGRFVPEIVGGVAGHLALSRSVTKSLLVFALNPSSLFLWALWISFKMRKGYPPVRTWAVYFVMSLLLSLLGIGKEGAGFDYFLEPIAVGTITIGIGLNEILPHLNKSFLLKVALILTIIQCSIVTIYDAKFARYLVEQRQLSIQDRVVIQNLVNSTPRGVLTDDPGLVVGSDKKLNIASFEYKLFVENHMVSVEPLIAELNQGGYDLCLLESPVGKDKALPKPILNAIADKFHLVTVLPFHALQMYGPYHIYIYARDGYNPRISARQA